MDDEVRQIFNKFDKNGDGRISSSELKEMLATLGSKTNDEVNRMMEELDKNGDGFLDLKEFVDFHCNNDAATILNELKRRKLSLRSSDNVVLEMKKSAAMSQSVVLGDHFDFTSFAGLDDKDEIPVQVPSLVLPKIISFCNKNHKFNSIIEGAVEQLKGAMNCLKGTVNDYMDWITSFVKSNKPLFSHLHQAADYLHIPALLELTSMAVGDMKESSVQEISDWYAGLSIPRMLSPLGIQAYSTLSQLDFFS